MKIIPMILKAAVLIALVGCEQTAVKKVPSEKAEEFLTVNFQDGRSLRYKFASNREITVEWDTQKAPGSGKNTSEQTSESMEIIMTYTPVDIDPYGLSTVKATCESVKVFRSRGTRTDAVQSLIGKTFTITVTPSGTIEDYSQLDKLIKETGIKAFRENTDMGRIKEPDMIGDFVAFQWFLWDAVSSKEKPSEGICVGQSWKSKLPVPAPMVMRKARDVTYVLDEIRHSEKGQLAVISSSYQIADSAPHDWPIPYSGSFQVAGEFGFYRNYQVLDLQGQGQELFNIDAGRTERYNQEYQMQLKASLLIPLAGANPRINIKQTLTMELLEN